MCYVSNPKPQHLRVERSQWYGLTVFTDRKILKDKVIAMTVKANYNDVEGYFSTPFGNIFNSTEDYRDINAKAVVDNDIVRIISTRDIVPGEEILLAYK